VLKVIGSAAVLFGCFMFLPAVKEIIGSLITVIESTFALSEFETAFFKFYPFIPIIMIFLGAIWLLMGFRKTEE